LRHYSVENVPDEVLDSALVGYPLLVLGRDELGEQPEGDELDPDDDEQHAECEQGTLPDSLPHQLDNGEVKKNHGADRPHDDPEASEEV